VIAETDSAVYRPASLVGPVVKAWAQQIANAGMTGSSVTLPSLLDKSASANPPMEATASQFIYFGSNPDPWRTALLYGSFPFEQQFPVLLRNNSDHNVSYSKV
jgi:hypothetical protein